MPTCQEQIQRLTLKSHRKDNIGKLTLERKWTMNKDKPKAITLGNSHIEDILNRQTVNLSDIQFQRSRKQTFHIRDLTFAQHHRHQENMTLIRTLMSLPAD